MNNETKHTPGPWKIATDYAMMQKGRADIVSWDNQGCPIAKVVCGTLTSTQDPSESIANAWLISAAPELLEACKAIHNDPYVVFACADKIRAAIAKAEGRNCVHGNGAMA